MKPNRPVLLAILISACLGALLGGLALVLTERAPLDFVEQKVLSVRYRILERLPQSAQPEFLPTPLATLAPDGLDTETPPPAAITSTLPPAATPRPSVRRPTLAPNLTPVQPSVALRGVKHDYQRWNNCGPTTLEMALSYFGRTDTQAETAAFLKPNYDDRNVRPDEMAAYVSRTGLRSVIRVNGSIDLLRTLLSNGLPVIVETALVKQPQGWMGHYRLLVGYDANGFNTMDSYDGPNVKISFDALDGEWRAFNRIYLVIHTEGQAERVRALIGDALVDATMYTQAVARARAESQANPRDAWALFNLGSSLYGLGRYAEAAAAFDRARVLGLPWRMLWYQYGPYEAALHTQRYDEVIALADSLLKGADDLEESHYYKGMALNGLGRTSEARREFETALRYNPNYQDARRALIALGSSQ